MAFSVDRYLGWRFHIAKRNCWHMARAGWLDLTGDDLGDLTPARISAGALGAAFDDYVPSYVPLPEPMDPCLVLMRRPPETPHVGIYYRGKILQATPAGASYMPIPVATAGYPEVGYYRPCL